MAIINRIARLFKADIHAVLDHIEEPELQLKQSIREMEDELSTVETQIQTYKLQIETLASRESAAHLQLKLSSEEILICFENKNEELAKGLVRRKLETTEIVNSLRESQKAAQKKLTELEEKRVEFASLLESMLQKSALILNPQTVSSEFDPLHKSTFTVSDNDVEVALLKERQNFNAETNAG